MISLVGEDGEVIIYNRLVDLLDLPLFKMSLIVSGLPSLTMEVR
jgi:hypothetical protein